MGFTEALSGIPGIVRGHFGHDQTRSDQIPSGEPRKRSVEIYSQHRELDAHTKQLEFRRAHEEGPSTSSLREEVTIIGSDSTGEEGHHES